MQKSKTQSAKHPSSQQKSAEGNLHWNIDDQIACAF